MADHVKPDSLYERDFVAWTADQAAALRARRHGANALDYDNLAEEIEDLGKSEMNACLSFIDLIVEHLLKIQFIGGRDVPHWKGEIRNFRRDLNRRLTRTIRNRIEPELPSLFRDVVRQLEDSEMLPDAEAVSPALGEGYAWDQIVDPDWYPEPRA